MVRAKYVIVVTKFELCGAFVFIALFRKFLQLEIALRNFFSHFNVLRCIKSSLDITWTTLL